MNLLQPQSIKKKENPHKSSKAHIPNCWSLLYIHVPAFWSLLSVHVAFWAPGLLKASGSSGMSLWVAGALTLGLQIADKGPHTRTYHHAEMDRIWVL